ncbi:uncharacterized protein [Channa argus]|uniref:uncharacterized protein n=1 Tax=Channa argus TaxID=215402 RepID=UPI003521027B
MSPEHFIFLAAATAPLSFIVKVGEDVTLPCESGTRYVCSDSITWLFSSGKSTVELTKNGKIEESVKSKSDRLSVTQNCSMAIRKVTIDDVGRYVCRLFIRRQQHGEEPSVYLSVLNMTEHKNKSTVTLRCSVWTYGQCRHRVKWLIAEEDVNEDSKDWKTSQATCSGTVTKPKKDNMTCNVKDGYTGKVHLFTFIPQSSDEDTGMWWCIRMILCLAGLIITVVALVRWKKTKVNRMAEDELISNHAGSQELADHENEVSYASINFQTNSTSQVRGKGNAVIYSSVKAAASTDPNNLYTNLN